MLTFDVLDNAIAAHANWKARLRMAASTGKFDVTPTAVKADNQCEFGKVALRNANVSDRKTVTSLRPSQATAHPVSPGSRKGRRTGHRGQKDGSRKSHRQLLQGLNRALTGEIVRACADHRAPAIQTIAGPKLLSSVNPRLASVPLDANLGTTCILPPKSLRSKIPI